MFSILAQNRRRGWQNLRKKTGEALNFVILGADFEPKLKTWSRQIMFYIKNKKSPNLFDQGGPPNLGNVQNKGYFFSGTSSLSQTAKQTRHLRWWILEFVSPITISVTIFQPVWVLVLELKCDLIRLEMELFMARFNHFWKDEKNLFEKKLYSWQEKNSTARLGAYVESVTSVKKLI